MLTSPVAGSHSSTAAAALPAASEMHQASGSRSSGYHGTGNCSSTPPAKGEQQSALVEYRARHLEKQNEKGRRQQLVLQGEQKFAKPLNMTHSIPDPLCESFSTNGYSAGESG